MNKEIEIDNSETFESYADMDTVASIVSGWTKEADQMLPKEPEEIKELLLHGVTVQEWVLGRSSVLVGFGAITFNWPNNCKELGCVVTKKSFRQKGVGHSVVNKLVEAAQNMYPDTTLFALCNEKSLKLFLDNGGEIITEPDILPKEVFGECVKCPKFQDAKAQGKLCCDIPVLIPKKATVKEPEPLGCHR